MTIDDEIDSFVTQRANAAAMLERMQRELIEVDGVIKYLRAKKERAQRDDAASLPDESERIAASEEAARQRILEMTAGGAAMPEPAPR